MRGLLPAALASALCAPLTFAEAPAFTASIAESKDRTAAHVTPSGRKLTPYAEAITQVLLVEIKRTRIPFLIASPFVFIVKFGVNRRGQLVDLKLLQGSNSAEANLYAEMIVRRASAKFPPAPADLSGEYFSFIAPFIMTYRDATGETAALPAKAIGVSPSRSPARRHGRSEPR